MESQFKVFIGRETAALGEPVAIATAQADSDEEGFISEHFIILPKRTPCLERSRLRYKTNLALMPRDLLAITDIMSVEIHRTRNWLQNLVLSTLTDDEKEARHLLVPYVLSGVEKSLLVQFKIGAKFLDELKKIRQSTRCAALRDYLMDIEKIPAVEVSEEPMLTDVGAGH